MGSNISSVVFNGDLPEYFPKKEFQQKINQIIKSSRDEIEKRQKIYRLLF